jgi:hypothetical protein
MIRSRVISAGYATEQGIFKPGQRPRPPPHGTPCPGWAEHAAQLYLFPIAAVRHSGSRMMRKSVKRNQCSAAGGPL